MIVLHVFPIYIFHKKANLVCDMKTLCYENSGIISQPVITVPLIDVPYDTAYKLWL